MFKGSTKVLRVPLALGAVVAIASGLAACGGSSSKSSSSSQTDPVATALKAPGVRTVVIPEQRSNVTVFVPPCSGANVAEADADEPPPGSNEVLIPRGSLTETVAVQPCSSSSSQTNTAGTTSPSTLLMTPGGGGGQGSKPSSQQQNQLVLPENSKVRTVIVPPCTPGGTGEPPKNQALPDEATVTAPACTVPKPPSGG